MILDVSYKEGSWGRFVIIKCDQCEATFQKTYLRKHVERLHHFCSRQCMNNAKRSGGTLNLKFEATNVERYGVKNVFQSEKIKRKSVETLRKNYGSNVINPSQVKILRQKAVNTWIANYGVDSPIKSDVVKLKIAQTNEKRYGVKNAFTLAHVRGTAVLSFNNEDVRKRALNERIKRGVIRTSMMESRFFDKIESWGYNVERQVRVSKWPIDALIDGWLHVQHDGVFHHGMIEKSMLYFNVQKQVLRDRAQDEWFRKKNISLLRISSSAASNLTCERFQGVIDQIMNGRDGLKIV